MADTADKPPKKFYCVCPCILERGHEGPCMSAWQLAGYKAGWRCG